MKIFAKLVIKTKSAKFMEALSKALEVENKSLPSRRGSVNATIKGDELSIYISSETISGVRSLLNAYLYLIYSVITTLEAVESGNVQLNREDAT